MNRILVLTVLCVLAGVAAGCGKKSDPLPVPVAQDDPADQPE